ncbi:MAG: transcriptional repressor LexA [Gammaproteobacteria bacterium]|mgnify:FL=1|tara:strand:- start:94 stop:696 length:603 start_codon:yes stop_codon:yes gene_type:complete
MDNLTKRQEEIFSFIKNQVEINGYPPTRSEIAKFFGFKSPNAAEDHLKALKKKGAIDMISGTSRGISLNMEDLGIPVIGLVSAGGPILAQENIEKHIPSTQNIMSHGVDYYLRVKGDSMVEVGILENDLIAVNKKVDVKKGSIVIARINDEVTVKTLESISADLVVLKPENSKYSNIEVNPKKENVAFEGTCVGLLRDFS